jgi:hypothetical protein
MNTALPPAALTSTPNSPSNKLKQAPSKPQQRILDVRSVEHITPTSVTVTNSQPQTTPPAMQAILLSAKDLAVGSSQPFTATLATSAAPNNLLRFYLHALHAQVEDVAFQLGLEKAVRRNTPFYTQFLANSPNYENLLRTSGFRDVLAWRNIVQDIICPYITFSQAQKEFPSKEPESIQNSIFELMHGILETLTNHMGSFTPAEKYDCGSIVYPLHALLEANPSYTSWGSEGFHLNNFLQQTKAIMAQLPPGAAEAFQFQETLLDLTSVFSEQLPDSLLNTPVVQTLFQETSPHTINTIEYVIKMLPEFISIYTGLWERGSNNSQLHVEERSSTIFLNLVKTFFDLALAQFCQDKTQWASIRDLVYKAGTDTIFSLDNADPDTSNFDNIKFYTNMRNRMVSGLVDLILAGEARFEDLGKVELTGTYERAAQRYADLTRYTPFTYTDSFRDGVLIPLGFKPGQRPYILECLDQHLITPESKLLQEVEKLYLKLVGWTQQNPKLSKNDEVCIEELLQCASHIMDVLIEENQQHAEGLGLILEVLNKVGDLDPHQQINQNLDHTKKTAHTAALTHTLFGGQLLYISGEELAEVVKHVLDTVGVQTPLNTPTDVI